MVIALGYRVQSQVATRFRRWATQRLHEYIQKRFAMDDERLKKGVIVTSVSCCNVSGIFVVVNVTSVNKLRTYMLFQPAIPSDTLQRAVHVVADRWHGKDEVVFRCGTVVFDQLLGDGQQFDMERRSGFLTVRDDSAVPVERGFNMIEGQFLHIRIRQTGETTEYENISHVSQPQIRHRLGDQHLDLFFR